MVRVPRVSLTGDGAFRGVRNKKGYAVLANKRDGYDVDSWWWDVV